MSYTRAEWYDNVKQFYNWRDTFITSAGLASDTAIASTYYDGQLGAFKLADHYGVTSPYYSWATNLRTAYRNYGHANTAGAHFSVPGYWAFGGGMAEAYTRLGDAQSLADLQDLCTYAAYHNSNNPGTLPGTTADHELCREWSYRMLNYLALRSVASLSAGQTTVLGTTYTDLLKIAGDWTGHTATYMRPFMVSLVCHALIDFYDAVATAPQKATIRSTITALCDLMVEDCYLPDDSAMTYSDRDLGVPEDLLPAWDLNMLIAPAFAWVWSKTSTTSYKTVAEDLFQGSFQAYLGYQANPLGKQINQQIVWGTKAFEWLGDEVAPGAQPGSGTSTATNGLVLLGCGCGAGGQAGAGAFDATQYGTVIAEWDFSASAKVLDGGGAAAGNNSVIATVNPLAGAGTLTQTVNGNRPILKTNVKNGLSVADFDGTGHWLKIADTVGVNRSNLTAVIVFKLRDASGSTLMQFQDNAGSYFRADLNNTNNSMHLTGYRSGGVGIDRYGSNLSLDTWYAGLWQYNYGGNTSRADTADGNTLADAAADGAGASPNIAAVEGSTLGANNIYSSLAANVQIGEVIMYSTALDSTQRSGLFAALEAKWGALA